VEKEKTMKRVNERKLSVMESMNRVAHWCGPVIKTPMYEKGDNFVNGPYCPVTVETKNLSEDHTFGHSQS
jgi:hypothetical protein